MKCIWRILLALLTAGISEAFRHRGHKLTGDCPLPSAPAVDLSPCKVSELTVGDMFLYNQLFYAVVSVQTNDKCVVAYPAKKNSDFVHLSFDVEVYRIINI